MDTNNKNLLTLEQMIKQNKCFLEYVKYKQAVKKLYCYIDNLLFNIKTVVKDPYNKNRNIIGVEGNKKAIYINHF